MELDDLNIDFWNSNFKFSIDKMLAFLAKKLRILGFDTYLRQDSDNLNYFIEKSILENRFIITTSLKLLSVVLSTKRYRNYLKKIIFIDMKDLLSDNLPSNNDFQNLIKHLSVRIIHFVFLSVFNFCKTNYNLSINKDLVKKLIVFINRNKLSRCLICNNKVIEKPNSLYYCGVCDKFYWEGYHHKNINSFVNSVMDLLESSKFNT